MDGTTFIFDGNSYRANFECKYAVIIVDLIRVGLISHMEQHVLMNDTPEDIARKWNTEHGRYIYLSCLYPK